MANLYRDILRKHLIPGKRVTKFCLIENTKSQGENIKLRNMIERVPTRYTDFLVSFIEQNTVFDVYALNRCV